MLHMSKNNLTELLIKAQDGDRIAYASFLTECSSLLHVRLRKWNNRREIIEEITQEVLIGIHRNLHTFLPNRDAAAWVMGIARYKLIDYFRKNPHKYQELTVDVTIESSEPNNALEDILKDLPILVKEALLLTKINGLSTKEAAAQLGIKENALRTRISRALSQLRKDLRQ